MAWERLVTVGTPVFNAAPGSLEVIGSNDSGYRIGVMNAGGGYIANMNIPSPYNVLGGYDTSRYKYRVAVHLSATSEFLVAFEFTPKSSIALSLFGSRTVSTLASYITYEFYIEREPKNTAPTTPGAFTSPTSGTVLNGGQTVTVTHGPSTDADGDALTYIVNAEYWNGTSWVGNTVVRNGTTSLTGTHTLSTNKSYLKVRFAAIARDSKGAMSSITRYSSEFTLSHNTAPTITATAPSGTYATKPSFNYNVTDPDGNTMTVTESIDGIVFNTRTGVASGSQLTFTPTDLAWLRTRIIQTVNITITANDGNGGVTTVNYPITRTTSAIDLELKTPFETDVAARRILLQLDGNIPSDAVLNVQACNNAFDAIPTWENATNLVLSAFPYPFNNTVKTAAKWGISFKIRIERGSSTQSIYLDGVGGAFD